MPQNFHSVSGVEFTESFRAKNCLKKDLKLLKKFLHIQETFFPVNTYVLRHKKVQKITSKAQICGPQLSSSNFFNAILVSSRHLQKFSQSQRSLYLALEVISNLIGLSYSYFNRYLEISRDSLYIKSQIKGLHELCSSARCLLIRVFSLSYPN